MSASRMTWSAVLAVSAALSAAPAAEAQDPPAQPPARQPSDTELVFDREVFSYPSFTRSNPFRALVAGAAGGPRFEQLTLVGIIYSPDPSVSLAHLTTGSITVAEDGTRSATEGDSYYLRAGDSVGTVTVRTIYRDRIDVTVTEFDEQIPRTMTFVSRRPGGSP